MADLVLVQCGNNKIQVIKSIRQLTSLGLKEAKDLADAADAGRSPVIAAGMPDDLASQWAQHFSTNGATTQVRSYGPQGGTA